jgi:hypothetical protein
MKIEIKRLKNKQTKTTYDPNGLRGLTVVKHVMYCGDYTARHPICAPSIEKPFGAQLYMSNKVSILVMFPLGHSERAPTNALFLMDVSWTLNFFLIRSLTPLITPKLAQFVCLMFYPLVLNFF